MGDGKRPCLDKGESSLFLIERPNCVAVPTLLLIHECLVTAYGKAGFLFRTSSLYCAFFFKKKEEKRKKE